MASPPTDVGPIPTAFYQLMYRQCYVRNECRGEKCIGHVVRPASIIGPGRFLGLSMDCAGDLDEIIEKAIAYFQREKERFEFRPVPDKDWEAEAGR